MKYDFGGGSKFPQGLVQKWGFNFAITFSQLWMEF